MKSSPLIRGLIEVSNLCQKNCLYCGIRRGNSSLSRYHLSVEEVLTCAEKALALKYPAIALQAGELESEKNTAFYEEVLHKLPPALEVTLSLGEQTEEVYQRWKIAGGNRVIRYLLRIETSNPELYAKIHPAECSFARRVECIRTLKRLGYVTGSGVMIGLPGQTMDDLKRDLDWFEAMNLDMVGMGPYIPDPSTPLFDAPSSWTSAQRFQTAIWMISEVRRRMPNINIVSATALEALKPGEGQLAGLSAGANVIMPNITPAPYRAAYNLYPGKPTAV